MRSFATIDEADRAKKPVRIEFLFHASPKALIGRGRLEAVQLERTRVIGHNCVNTGEVFRLPADLLVTAIGYRTTPISGVPYDEKAGRFANEEGRIASAHGDLGGLYCAGWARRGPTGTIGTNRPDGYALLETILADFASAGNGAERKGGTGFDALARERGLDIVSFRDWKRIEQAETAAAREGSPREKFVDIEAMIEARGAAGAATPGPIGPIRRS